MGALEPLTGHLKGSQNWAFPAALPVTFSIPGCAAALGVEVCIGGLICMYAAVVTLYAAVGEL